MNKEQDTFSTKRIHVIYISIILLLWIVLGAETYYIYVHKAAFSKRPMPSGAQTGSGKQRGMNMAPGTVPQLSNQQKQQLNDGASTASTHKTFNITGGNFYFVPNKITVNKGDEVTLVVTNGSGVHDLVIDDLQVKTSMTRGGETSETTFTASKSGTYTYYCSVPGHREKGMVGTLIVQ